MFFKLIFLSFLAIVCFGDDLVVEQAGYFEDIDNKHNIETILENPNFFLKSDKVNLGIRKNNIWTHSIFISKEDTKKNLIFTNQRVGIDFIDIYVFCENKMIKNVSLGDMRLIQKKAFVHRKPSFLLEVEPNKQYDIFVKYKSYGAIDINWLIVDQNEFLSYNSNETLIFGIIAGFVLLISIYIFFIDRLFPSMYNKIYFWIMISTLLLQFSVSGIFYQLGINIYINTIISWSVGNFSAALFGLFPIYFFNLKKNLPKTTILISILSYSLIGFSVVFLFYPLNYNLLYLATYANMILLILIILLFLMSVILCIKKIQGSFFYFVGNGFFTLGVIYFLFGLLGIVNIDVWFYYSLGIGSILNIFSIAFISVQRLHQIRKDKESALILLNEHSKLSSVGQAMINVSHQWKEPINHIYYAMNNILAAKEFQDKNLSQIIDDSLVQIKNTTNYMADTGKHFLEIYEGSENIENVDISDSISFAIEIFKKQIDDSNIKIFTKYEDNYFIKADKYLVSNIFLILLENSIKIFKDKNINKKTIKITTTKEDNNIIIKVCDNAGGIKITPIDYIFEKNLSDSSSTGLGLFLAKNILTLKLNGDIKATNTEDGVCFRINLKN